jgi:hypothetical protein
MTDLGLATGTTYLAFDFWGRRSLGAFRDSLVAGAVDPSFQVQVLCLREQQPHPQLLATNRHVSCGGVDLERVSWNADVLSGTSRVVKDDDYEMYLSEPEGWEVASVDAINAQPVLGELRDRVRRVTIRGAQAGRVSWSVRYRRAD